MTLNMTGIGDYQSVEGRIQQIESMLQSLSAPAASQPARPTNGFTAGGASFKTLLATYAKPGVTTRTSETVYSLTPDSNTPKPFQFYLSAPHVAKTQKAALQPMIESLSRQYGVDKHLVNAVIQQESGFNPNAVSKAGATGLMQLMPAAAKTLGVSEASNPAQNLDGGIRHLKGLLTRFNGNIPLALAAYNAGPGAVQRYQGIPPYHETQRYVRNIMTSYLQSRRQANETT